MACAMIPVPKRLNLSFEANSLTYACPRPAKILRPMALFDLFRRKPAAKPDSEPAPDVVPSPAAVPQPGPAPAPAQPNPPATSRLQRALNRTRAFLTAAFSS